jgi:O-antigen/teichoic acid export membrane protein
MHLKHLGHCLVGMGVAVVVLLALGVQSGTILGVAAALACPLMMVFCMGYAVHRLGRSHRSDQTTSAETEHATQVA